ncbi:MAG: hypothetical protein PUA90_00035 [bacterium]|nr:hypothetical protein [bacterium]
MKKTRMLISILSLLIIAICFTIVIQNFDLYKEKYIIIKNMVTPKKVSIPSTISNNRNFDFLTVEPTNDFEPKNMDDLKKLYYTVLNNGWTDFTFYCPDEYTDCFDDVLLLADNNEYINVINNYVSTFNQYLKYNTSISQLGEIKLTIEKLYTNEEILVLKMKISEILKSFNINKDNIKVQDIMRIHNYILNLLTYDEEYKNTDLRSTSATAYGALNTKKAICSGYTDLFALFLDELNIPNFKVSSENHIWNAIYFGDKWRHIDVTWDDDEINKNNNYNFFMISTDELLSKDSEEHNFNKELYLEFLNQ